MSKRTGKFVGAYVDAATKRRLKVAAARLDRPLSYVLEKILERGVKHLLDENAKPIDKAA